MTAMTTSSSTRVKARSGLIVGFIFDVLPQTCVTNHHRHTSHKRSAIHWRTIGWGLALQWVFAAVILKGSAIASLLSFLPFPKGLGWAVLALDRKSVV